MAEEGDQKPAIPFAALSKTLDGIQRTKGHAAKKKIASGLLRERDPESAETMLRLLLPHLDHARVLGVKEKTLAKMYSETLGIEGTPDAARLLDWRNPTLASLAPLAGAANHHDFAQTLFSVVRDRILASLAPSQGAAAGLGLSVQDVSDKLSELASADNYIDRKAVIAYFVSHLSPTEHKWLARIILKEMKLGITERTVFDIWHPEAQDLYNITSSLSRVAKDLADKSVSVISSTNVSLNFPFKPMLSKSVKSLESVERLMKHKTFWVETKLDGERMQLHKSGGNYKWFSRNAKDYTHLYGSYKDEKMAQYVHEALITATQNCILDGEMMSLNTATGLFESFGALKSAANLFAQHGDNATSKPVYIVFDILFLNGESLLESPLNARYQLLQKVLRDRPGKVEVLKHVEGSSTEDVVRALDVSMVNHEEGIVIKNPEGSYLMNDRGGDWLKVKPDYIDSLGDDVDLVLIGGFYGTGRRGGKLSHFMCAVVDDKTPPGSELRYISFCKFGSGYTLTQIEEIAHESSGHWQPFDPRNPPAWFVHPPHSKEKPDMIVHPRNSRVVCVKAAEVVESTQYAAGYTLRFPRFVSVRLDKNVEDGAMSRSELEEYVSRNKGRMQSRRFGGEGAGDMKPVGKRSITARSVAVVAAEYQEVKKEGLIKLDDMLSGMELCVIAGSVVSREGECIKHALESEIIKHGGSCVQNPRLGKTKYVLAEKPIIKVNNLIKDGLFDIVKPAWLLDCVYVRYMIYTADETRRHFKRVNDKYGDSYSQDVTADDLCEIFKTMPSAASGVKRPASSFSAITAATVRQKHLKSIANIEQRYAAYLLDSDVPCSNERRVLRNCCVYLDIFDPVRIAEGMLSNDRKGNNQVITISNADENRAVFDAAEADYSSLTVWEPLVRTYGGQVCDVLGPWTTHIVLASPGGVDCPLVTVEEQRAREAFYLRLLLNYPERHTKRPNIVTSLWIKDQIDSVI
ncbi:ATP dependent DNA ligase domain-containing protein [Chytriomyces sp. MP71]|nr:ATP dependent DNA ligase domain-containing protein [Chytriomyces sp. MP71]